MKNKASLWETVVIPLVNGGERKMYEKISTGSATNGTISSIGVPGDVPRISREMATIQNLIAENRELVATIEQRLAAVLRPSPPQASGGIDGPRSASSPLVADLEGFSESLKNTAARCNDILSRLDV